MARTFKVLSLLLSYPEEELCAAAADLREVLKTERLLPDHVAGNLLELIDQLEKRDRYDLQERYVLLFDRTRSLSLHLFEHVHGEGRDRGQAMVDLAELYEKHGLEVRANELPDYLPLFLEFLSTLSFAEAQELLGQPLHIVTALGERLRKRESSYQWVFRAIEALATATPDTDDLNELLQVPDDDPNDLQALDRNWEDEPVTFGPNANGRGTCNQVADLLRRIGADLSSPKTRRPADGTGNREGRSRG